MKGIAAAALLCWITSSEEASCRAVVSHRNRAATSHPPPAPTCQARECATLDADLSAPVNPPTGRSPGQQMTLNFTRPQAGTANQATPEFLTHGYCERQ